jgi:hypothetical protein
VTPRHPAELRADALPVGAATPLRADELRELLPQYTPAVGLGRGRHLQRAAGQGRYHLTIGEAGGAELHRDRWNPDTYPLRHVLEVPHLWAPAAFLIGAAWLGSLRRR